MYSATGVKANRGRTGGRGALLPLAFGAAVGAGLIGAPAAPAASFTVTNLGDSGPGSLRDAIESANLSPGADTILFQSGLSGTIDVTSGPMYSYEPLTIDGPGSGALTVRGDGSSQLLVQYGDPGDPFAIDGLTLEGGYGVIGANVLAIDTVLTVTDVRSTGAQAVFGAGLAAAGGAVTIRNSQFSGNDANVGSAGLYVCSDGRVTIEDTEISGNQALGLAAGSICAETIAISRSEVRGNRGSDYTGGISLFSDAGASITDSVLSGNQGGLEPSSAGGALSIYGGPVSVDRTTIAGNSALFGGGIAVECGTTLTLTRSTVSGNTAGSSGGGVGACQAGLVAESSTFAGNRAAEYGGAIAGYAGGGYELSLTATTIAGNEAAQGGGVAVDGGGQAVLESSLVAGNSAASGPNLLGDFGGNDNLAGSVAGATVAGTGNQLDVANPMLLPLADNGGPTQTVLVEPDSPAVDAGSPSLDGTNDQRGLLREDADVGAAEAATCRGVLVNRIGTDGNDVLEGTSGPDGFFGFAGDDELTGLGEGDGLCAGKGDDAVYGGDGPDSVLGNRGEDVVAGGTAGDELSGGGGADDVSGGAGTDRASGGNADDDLAGGPGDSDRVLGGNGSDHLAGGSGVEDRCNGNRGRNRAEPNCDIVTNAKVIGAAATAAADVLNQETDPTDDAAAQTDEAADAVELGEPGAVRPGGAAAE